MIVYRISNHADLSGAGGLRAPGRWNSLGRRIVYCSSSVALCQMEMLVHVERELIPDSYRLLTIELPDEMTVFEPELPDEWQQDVSISRTVFEEFCVLGSAAIMRAPSAIVPEDRNYLINPLHPDARMITVLANKQYEYDERLRR